MPLQTRSRCLPLKLELHTATGESFEVDKGMMQGFWSLDAQGQSWFHSYYYLDATTQKRPGVDWWVYDTETHDRSPVNQADLSGWAAPDADLDSDGDGIPDWWETAWGLDPGKPADIALDSDGDGLPDWWELYWGLDPYDRDQNKNGIMDGDDDFDGDSRSNKFEYQNRGNSPGEDPGRPPEDQSIPPRAPTDLDLVPGGGEGKVILKWIGRSSNETGFVIEGFKRFYETPEAPPVYRWTTIKTTAKGARTFAIKSPELFSRYRVYAENSAGRSRPTREISVDLIHVGVDGNSGIQQEGAKVDVKLEIDGVTKNITAAEIREEYEIEPDMDPPVHRFLVSEFGESISVFRKRGETYSFKWELDVTGYEESHVSGSSHLAVGGGASEISQKTQPEGHPDPTSSGTYKYEGSGTVKLPEAVLRIYDPGTIGTPGPEVTEAAQDGTRHYLLRLNTDHDEDPAGASADCDNTDISSQDDDLVTVEMYFAPGAFSDGTVTLRVPSGVRLFVKNTQSETEEYIPLVVPAATNSLTMDCANPGSSPLEPLLRATPLKPFVIYLEGTWTAQAGKLALEYRKKDEPITNAPWISSEVVLLPIEITSDRATINPKYRGSPSKFDLCNHTEHWAGERIKGALTIYHKAVRDETGKTEDFDVTLKVASIGNLTWTKVSGPDSGAFIDPHSATAVFRNPKKGGLYEFELSVAGQTAGRLQLWLPVAGPDISSYWEREISYFKNTWGPAYRSKLHDRTWLISLPMQPYQRWLLKKEVATADMTRMGNDLDWNKPVVGEETPCGVPDPDDSNPGNRLTLHGFVISWSKRNNMLYALIGREMGLPERVLISAGHIINMKSSGGLDSAEAVESYRAGFDLFNGVTLENVMKTRGLKMHEPNGWDQLEWPSHETSEAELERMADEKLQQLIQ